MNGPVRVLVVDDVVEYAEMVVEFVRASGAWEGAETATAASYEAALRALTTSNYDVAFIDYRLGARDGVALLREIRGYGVGTPVVILTGHGDEHVAVEAMKAGAADYVGKMQVSVDAIDRAIRHALALRAEEQQRRQAERALRASEKRFRALVENSSDVLLLVDREMRIQYATSSAERHLGWTPDQMRGHSLFDFLHSDDHAAVTAEVAERLAAPGATVTLELRVRHADGVFRIMELVLANRFDEPEVNAIVVNARDMTERRRLEDRLQHVHRLEAVGQLAGGVAHDFNNLLTVILGYCNLMLEDVPEENPLRQDLGEIRSAGERALSLTRQLLPRTDVAVPVPQPAQSDADAATKTSWETVLLVEEESAVRALTREVLRRQGYTVLEARHGVDAIRLAERQRDEIHLLVADVDMARMSGRDLARRLTSARPDMKVLFLAGQAEAARAGTGADGGAVLARPFTAETLTRAVRQVLDARRPSTKGRA